MRPAARPAAEPMGERLAYYSGSRWLPAVVATAVAILLAVALLDRLAEVQVRAEQVAVDLTVRHLRTGLRHAQVDALLQGQGATIAGWGGRNPVDWLEAPPPGYLGERREVAELPPGAWYFDAARRELIYRPRYPGRWPAPRSLRWRVRVTQAGATWGAQVEEMRP